MNKPLNIITKLLTITILFLVTSLLIAKTIDKYPFSDPTQQQRFQQLSEQFRCLVCQNQSLADSDASLAQDLREQIYQQVQAGYSDEQIKTYLTTRYGDFVLYNPPLRVATIILWFLPGLLIIVGGFIVYRQVRKHQKSHSN